MPDDADEKCSAEDSAKVADYIYNACYSSDARVRNKPARVELSRLTVRQYQNAVADLIGGFKSTAERGSASRPPGENFHKRNPWRANKPPTDLTAPRTALASRPPRPQP